MCAQLILAEMELDEATTKAEAPTAAQDAEASLIDKMLSEASASVDAASDLVRGSVAASVKDEDLVPRYGLAFLSMKEADAFVRIAGARTAPYRVATGGKSTSRTYVCRSHKRPRFKKNVATGEAEEEGSEDDGDEDSVQDDDDAACHCNACVVIQQCTVRSLMQGSFRKKRSVMQEEVEAGVQMMRSVPPGFTSSSKVFGVTRATPHSCSRVTPHPGGKAANPGDDVEEGCGNTGESTVTFDDEDIRLRRSTNERSLTSSQLAHALRAEFEAAQRCRPWGLKVCREAVLKLDEGAGGTAGMVLRKLRAVHALPPELELELLQGLAVELRAVGFGVALHVADADAVRAQAMELAKKRYYACGRRAGRKLPRFSEKGVASYLQDVSDDATYIVGWTLIPPNMMSHTVHASHGSSGGRGRFIGVDALDCAGFRGRGQGILVVRATHDANEHVHPISVSHMLAAEGDLSVGAHIDTELELIGAGEMDQSARVTIVDGGLSLVGQVHTSTQAREHACARARDRAACRTSEP